MMVLTSFDALKKHLSSTTTQPKKVVVANPTDEQTLSAVMTLLEANILSPILVGEKQTIVSLLEKMAVAPQQIAELEIVDVTGDEEIAFQAVSLIRQQQGDVLMKGHIQTRDLLKAVVNKETGIRKQKVLSHVAINEIPYYHKLLFLTDGGMLLTPDLAMKKEILTNVLSLTKELGYTTTNVGVLDASENVNPKLPASLDAQALKQAAEAGEFPGAVVEGPISLDLSISQAIAREKEYESPVAGEVDVLLVPDIVAGNLLGKSMMTFGNGQMAGLVLGATVPIIVTSRGSTTAEKINSLMIACAI